MPVRHIELPSEHFPPLSNSIHEESKGFTNNSTETKSSLEQCRCRSTCCEIRKSVNPRAVASIYGDERGRSEQSGQRETVVSGDLSVRHVFAD